MTNDNSTLKVLPVVSKLLPQKLTWQVLGEDGTEIFVTGTSIITEEEVKIVHIFDGKDCIFVGEFDRISIHNDSRVSVKTPKKRPTKAKKESTK